MQSRTNFSNDRNLSVLQEPDIEYEYTINYVALESKSRDTTAYPQPNSYRIVFGDSYRNVKSIELIAATIPDKNSVLSEPYLVLKIDEFDNIESSDTNLDNAFTILQLNSPNSSGSFIDLDMYICSGTVKIFKTPLARLDRMSVSIRDYDNTLFDFGDDTSGSPPNKQFQNMLLFKIITQERKRDPLQHRNVF
jgi:hypothetical protein